jgi:hypothetical protein
MSATHNGSTSSGIPLRFAKSYFKQSVFLRLTTASKFKFLSAIAINPFYHHAAFASNLFYDHPAFSAEYTTSK